MILRDCDHCFHDRSGDCSRLTCIGFQYVGDIDTDALKSAAEAHDARNHGQNRHGSRRSQEASERVRASNQDRVIVRGKTLWYKDRNTGDICCGSVDEAGVDYFRFRFGNRLAVLPYDAINNRLFYTRDEARRYGKLKPGKLG